MNIESRSVQRRKALQQGKPMPDFSIEKPTVISSANMRLAIKFTITNKYESYRDYYDANIDDDKRFAIIAQASLDDCYSKMLLACEAKIAEAVKAERIRLGKLMQGHLTGHLSGLIEWCKALQE